jgi:hypothetical protein
MTSQSGRALGDIFEFLVLVIVVPPIVCCALQAAVAVIGMVLPWLILFGIALGVAGVLGAGFAVRRRVLPPIDGDLAIRVPPVRRPPGLPDRRHD